MLASSTDLAWERAFLRVSVLTRRLYHLVQPHVLDLSNSGTVMNPPFDERAGFSHYTV